jgi:hypothetical protein
MLRPSIQGDKLIISLVLIVIFLFVGPAGARTSTYVFVTDESTVVQTGGFMGIHETYPIEGQFQLSVDLDAGTASFDRIDANLTEPSGFLYTQSLGVLFNMTELLGIVIDDTTIEFEGKTSDNTGTDIVISLILTDDSVHLTGETIPPPGSADFFEYDLDAVAQKKYGGGTGEPNNPYLIYTAEQMNIIGAEPNDWDKHFQLMADIDLAAYMGTDFNIIGTYDLRPFTGVFNGNNHTIANFTYTCTDKDCIGLFGHVGPDAVIRDLRLIDPNIDAPLASPVGSLLGHLSYGTITNCYVVHGRVLGDYRTGGLVGLNYGTITKCYSSGSVWGNGGGVGGLVGSSEGPITYCYATATVSGDEEVGGLVGVTESEISNCYCEAIVSGNEYIGGLVGWNSNTITNCYSTGSSISGNRRVGGLVGYNGYHGTVTASFWDIETSGLSESGGGMGKTTAEMQMGSTFTDAGWDFVKIWGIGENQTYPYLRVYPAGDLNHDGCVDFLDLALLAAHWLEDNSP